MLQCGQFCSITSLSLAVVVVLLEWIVLPKCFLWDFSPKWSCDIYVTDLGILFVTCFLNRWVT